MAAKTEKTEKDGKKSIGLMGMIKAVAFIGAIVVVEVVAASMLLPSGSETEATAHKLAAAEKGHAAADDTHSDHGTHDAHGEDKAAGHGGEGDHHDTVEVELGRYNVTRYNPVNDTTLIVDFELFGVVLAEEQSDFTHHFEKNKVRLREQVIMTLGGADTTELTDAELGLLKRRILEKTNRALGKPMVQEVLFSKFNFVER